MLGFLERDETVCISAVLIMHVHARAGERCDVAASSSQCVSSSRPLSELRIAPRRASRARSIARATGGQSGTRAASARVSPGPIVPRCHVEASAAPCSPRQCACSADVLLAEKNHVYSCAHVLLDDLGHAKMSDSPFQSLLW